jgi:hypothetical protein
LEVTVNVQALRELKRVLANVPRCEFYIGNWHDCACGHATRDAWFRRQGFTHCCSFREAAAFFGITREEAMGLFSGLGWLVAPKHVIKRIDALLESHEAADQATQHARRQAVIDDLLKRATRAAAKAREVTTALVAMFV